MKKIIFVSILALFIFSCSRNLTPSSKKTAEQPSVAVIQNNSTNTSSSDKPKVGAKSILNEPNVPIVKNSNATELAENPRETPQVLEGKTTYKTKCAKCHDTKDPQSYDAAKWVKILDWMAPRAKLDANEKANVLAYVTLYAKR
jgi:cytochrome c5